MTVHSLTATAGVSQPAVSKHLSALKATGLLLPGPAGRKVYDRADPAALARLTGWLQVCTGLRLSAPDRARVRRALALAVRVFVQSRVYGAPRGSGVWPLL